MATFIYRQLEQTESGDWRPIAPEVIRQFPTEQARLDRLPNWERLGEEWRPREIHKEPRQDAPAWTDIVGPGTPPPVPPTTGSGLVVVRSERAAARRRGTPAATIEGTNLDTEGTP